MDPEANMREQVALAQSIIEILDDMPGDLAEVEKERECADAVIFKAERLAGLVLALAEWKKKGGA